MIKLQHLSQLTLRDTEYGVNCEWVSDADEWKRTRIFRDSFWGFLKPGLTTYYQPGTSICNISQDMDKVPISQRYLENGSLSTACKYSPDIKKKAKVLDISNMDIFKKRTYVLLHHTKKTLRLWHSETTGF